MSIENLNDEDNFLTDEQYDTLKAKLKKIRSEHRENDQQLQLLKNKLDHVLRKPERTKIKVVRKGNKKSKI